MMKQCWLNGGNCTDPEGHCSDRFNACAKKDSVTVKEPIQRWIPDTDPHQARRIGKTGEEVNELGAVLFRIQIQGIDAIDPASGKTNRQRFLEEMADVQAQIDLNIDHFPWTVEEVLIYTSRIKNKKSQMAEWEAHFK